MIFNPKICEIYVEQAQNWIKVNVQSLEPGDIIRFWETPEELTVCNGCSIFIVQGLPNIPCAGMTDELFNKYLEEDIKETSL